MAKTKNTYKNTEKVMEDYGIRITDEIVALLARRKKNASHRLSNSIDFDVVKDKNDIQLVIDYKDYGPKIRNKHSGALEGNVLRGRRPGSRLPPILAIEKWIKDKKISINVSKGSKSAKSTKNVNKVRSMAWAIAKSIARNGIPAFNFLKPYEETVTSKQYKKDLRAALVQDGYSSLNKPIADFNKLQAKK